MAGDASRRREKWLDGQKRRRAVSGAARGMSLDNSSVPAAPPYRLEEPSAAMKLNIAGDQAARI